MASAYEAIPCHDPNPNDGPIPWNRERLRILSHNECRPAVSPTLQYSGGFGVRPCRSPADLPLVAGARSGKMAHVKSILPLILVAIALPSPAAETNELAIRLQALEEASAHRDLRHSRLLNELLWFQRLSDMAVVDKVRFAGPPPRGTNAAAPPPGSNDVVVAALTFMPRQRESSKKLPLIVLVHGEIHGNVASDEDANVVRDLIRQGYAVIAPDYRGSSGYGLDYWRLIDYGGREVDDVHAARQYMLERHPEIDPTRVGVAGWSHGGLIALLVVFQHPDDFAACYAGVPVSDLEERIRIRGKDYENLFAAPYHIGKSLAEDPEEYRQRSPAWNAEKLRTPLLIHANTNDEDVTVREVRQLITALESAGRSFDYHIYTNAPGGHFFNRLDTPLAVASRTEIWQFLARYLQPPEKAR